ncbi:MAG: ABC transporter ATP-binding protein [Anaerolineae bacterium]|nr:ABC transporter ATP-binding protein [Anaerolineae bacterium]
MAGCFGIIRKERTNTLEANPNTRKSRRSRSQGRGAGREGFKSLGRALRFLGHYRRVAMVAYGALFVSSGAQLAVPRLVRNIIDAITNGTTADMILGLPDNVQSTVAAQRGTSIEQLRLDASGAEDAIIAAGTAIVVFAIARGLFAFIQGYMAERLSQSIAFDFRNELFAKIQRLSFSYHDRNQTGQLMIRATDDVEKVRLFIGQGLLLALQAVVLLTGTLIILLTTNFKLTLVALPILPLALVVFVVFGAIAQPLFTRLQIKLSNLNTVLQENLAGIQVIKAFVHEKEEQTRFKNAVDEHLSQGLKISRAFSFIFPLVFLIANLGQAAVLYAGSFQIVDNTLTLGEWQEFSLYLIYIFFPLGQLGFIISLMSQAAASSTRIYEILDAPNDVEDKPGAIVLSEARGNVAFESVSFRYFRSGDYVLKDVSLKAQAGETIALLGATGSGKTTIINLLPRFYDATEGHVLIDGHDVRDIALNSLRSQIGIVLQETNLFTGTIRDNIAFGRPEATMEEVIAVARVAAAHDFIMSFPEGYDTPVGERGTTLSGGQKQRIAIARALLLNPKILILDDSTSSVDVATEYEIQQALDILMKGRTSFVIAQRISTVLNADQILVLERGQIVAQGTHESLLETSPLYAQIYHSQLIEDVELEDGDTAPIGQEVSS